MLRFNIRQVLIFFCVFVLIFVFLLPFVGTEQVLAGHGATDASNPGSGPGSGPAPGPAPGPGPAPASAPGPAPGPGPGPGPGPRENAADSQGGAGQQAPAQAGGGGAGEQSGRGEQSGAGEQEGRPAGAQEGRPAGEQEGRPAGEQEGRPAGEQEGRPAGEQEGRPAGAQEGRPAGEQEGRPAGEQEGRPAGEQEGRPAGEQEGRPAGAQEGRPAGAQEGRPAGAQEGNAQPACVEGAIASGQGAAEASSQCRPNQEGVVQVDGEGGANPGQTRERVVGGEAQDACLEAARDRGEAEACAPMPGDPMADMPMPPDPERENMRVDTASALEGCLEYAETASQRSACASSARPQIQEFEKERQPIVDREEGQQGRTQDDAIYRDREGQEVRSDDANQGSGGQGQGGQAREGDQEDNRAVQPGGTPGGGIAPKPDNVYRGNDWSDKADRWVETTTEFDEDGNIMAIRKGQTELGDGKFQDSMLTREASMVGGGPGPGDTEDRSRETRRTAYDEDGNISVVLTTDREGNETTTEYDSEGRITWKESRDKKGDLLSAEIPTGERGGETAGRREQCMQGRGEGAEGVCDRQEEAYSVDIDGQMDVYIDWNANLGRPALGSEDMKAPKRGSREYDEKLYGQDSGEVVLDKKGSIRRTQMVNPDGSLTIREFDADGEVISSNTLGARNADGKFMSSTNDRLVGCRVGQDAGECASVDQSFGRGIDGHQCDQGTECEGDGSETSWRAPEGGGKYDDISARLSTSEERGQGGEIKSRVLKYQGDEESALSFEAGVHGIGDSADVGTRPSAGTMERLRETSDGGGVERANSFTADESGKLKTKSEWANRTAYAADGQVEKVENFARDIDGAVSFGVDDVKAQRIIADAAPAQAGSGAELDVKSRTGFSIKLDRGGRPVVAVSGETASNEGGISMDSGLDGFVLGFLPKYEKGQFDKKKGLNSRLDEEED